MIWPWLLGGAAICATRNWQAAVVFAFAVGVGQVTARLNLSQETLLLGYTLLAVVATFFLDRYSGFVLAAVGLVIGAHYLGLVDHRAKVLAGEAVLVLGMVFCGYNGPSGGIFEGRKSVDTYRHGADSGAVARSAQEDTALSKQNLP